MEENKELVENQEIEQASEESYEQELTELNDSIENNSNNQQKELSDSDRNFAALREAKEKLQKERDEAIQLLKEMYESQNKISHKQAVDEEENEEQFHINPDDLVEGKHLSRYNKELKKIKDELNNYKKQNTQTIIEAKLRNTYTDFDKVVNKKNVEELRSSYPELAATIASGSDLYSQAVSAYTLIKQFGIYKEAEHNPLKDRIDKNITKPKPVSSLSPYGGDALDAAKAFDGELTNELKQKLYEELKRAKQNY